MKKERVFKMTKLIKYGTVVAGLIMVGIMLILRWLMQAFYFIAIVLYTITEGAVNGLSAGIAHIQKVNNEHLTAPK